MTCNNFNTLLIERIFFHAPTQKHSNAMQYAHVYTFTNQTLTLYVMCRL